METALTFDKVETLTPPVALAEALSQIPDPRGARGKRYPIGVILTFCVCAMLCGARSLYAIAQWGHDHGAEMARILGFTRLETPCVATLHLLFKKLDVVQLDAVLAAYFAQRSMTTGTWSGMSGIAIDGKSLRGIHGEKIPGVHLVAAFAHEAGVVLGQKGGQG